MHRSLRSPPKETALLSTGEHCRMHHTKGRTCLSYTHFSSIQHGHAKVAIVTGDSEEGAWPLVITFSIDVRLVQDAGGIIISLWSSSPSKPPTANPDRPKCFT
ncbi:unnamed protein product [Prorocentrum cordatum]|uniref:Uncharacterized protein n=1 Tax=Prorocentrum cordatum TaxID=2364126 RepID=A0ABN9UHI2_9DINO|nr:unnamed protein product [Polarella glacialis]